jgi:hypothetical protein
LRENNYKDGPLVLKECWKELIDFLGKKQKTFNIVVMPDFFMDRIINLECNAEDFVSEFRGIVARKGGSIDQVAQSD